MYITSNTQIASGTVAGLARNRAWSPKSGTARGSVNSAIGWIIDRRQISDTGTSVFQHYEEKHKRVMKYAPLVIKKLADLLVGNNTVNKLSGKNLVDLFLVGCRVP